MSSSKRPLKPRSAQQSFILVLCLLALFVAQTIGSQAASFVCLCAGKPVPTQSSHCHGPHGTSCHTAEAESSAPHSEEGKGERQDHQAVSKDVASRPVDVAPQIIAPQVLVAILPLVETIFARLEAKLPASYAIDFRGSPPRGVAVARTIVLLI